MRFSVNRGFLFKDVPLAQRFARASTVAPRLRQFVEEHGGEVLNTPREVPSRCEILITMLPDFPDVEQVYLGEGSVIEPASARQI
jgi:3-hydroxyisobutyrate dehydrogenase-like beta-hydroxyacid dehydrogenase